MPLAQRTALNETLARAGAPLSKVLPAPERVPLITAALHPPPSHEAARDIPALAAGLLMYLSLGMYGAADDRLDVIVSPLLIGELETVVARSKFRRYSPPKRATSMSPGSVVTRSTLATADGSRIDAGSR